MGCATADLLRVQGVHKALLGIDDEADDMFEEGITLLQSLETKISTVCPGLMTLPTVKGSPSVEPEVFMNSTVAAILRESGESACSSLHC